MLLMLLLLLLLLADLPYPADLAGSVPAAPVAHVAQAVNCQPAFLFHLGTNVRMIQTLLRTVNQYLLVLFDDPDPAVNCQPAILL